MSKPDALPSPAADARPRIAIMQPYFFPYAGYFRLLTAVDEFVLLDCVQFARRGRVHRSEIARVDGQPVWLGLPLARQPREVLIRDLAFATQARDEFDRRLARHPFVAQARGPVADRLREFLHAPLDGVVDYLEAGLRLVLALGGREVPILRSSALGLDPALCGAERLAAIGVARGARSYVNAPGGRSLYSDADFAPAGITLEFFTPYAGPGMHLLPALFSPDRDAVLAELAADHSGEIVPASTTAQP